MWHDCRRWYPHPAENPFARNRGWLGAVVTLSSTGDAACGLHKQRLHRREEVRKRGGCNVATPSCVRFTLIQQRRGRGEAARRFAAPSARWQLVPWRDTRGFKDAPSAKQETSLFDARANRWIVLCPVLRQPSLPPSPVIPSGKPFEILPGKVRTKPRRLSRLVVVGLVLDYPSPELVFFFFFFFSSVFYARFERSRTRDA